ncbi:MAG TPA: hypothetical protein VF902_10200 [Coriobacteriia bacterium]
MRRWMVALLVVVLVFGLAIPAFATAAANKGVRAKPVFVQHPYTAKQKMKAGVEFNTWGYVTPKVSDFASKTVEILIYKRTGARTWEQTTTVDATMWNRGRIRNRTMYSAKVTLSAVGQYRMRAKYTWKAQDGTLKSRLSSYKYFRIVK